MPTVWASVPMHAPSTTIFRFRPVRMAPLISDDDSSG